MGGFFGVVSNKDCVWDVFFGVDYHSHLGTRYGGMVSYHRQLGFQREIHSIQSAPFRTKFERDAAGFQGTMGIGCISDTDPQPLMVRSHLGLYAIAMVGMIRNAPALIERISSQRKQQFLAMSDGRVNEAELTAMLINEKDSFAEGIRYAQEQIEGSCSILILTDSSIIVARDSMGRLPVLIGKGEEGYCVSFESFVCQKLGYQKERELGPGEAVQISTEGIRTLLPAREQMKICAFLWAYYGYPNSNYEGRNVELMRCENGAVMARDEEKKGTLPRVDHIAGVPDSGTPHAIGYANQCGIPFARPFIKYTPTWPRSFMPDNDALRSRIAKMKMIPVPELIEDKRILFVDDSIVRGTQLKNTVEFLYENGAKEVHMRSACPPIMYGCKYLNFSSSKAESELITRTVIQELEGEEGFRHLEEYADNRTERGSCMLKRIAQKMGFDSIGFQSIEGFLEAIGIDREKVCTYCWTGKE